MQKRGNKIIYHPLVVKRNIPSLDSSIKQRIKTAIENKLVDRPEVYGMPLRGTLKHYFKLRVGDWRIVYLIQKQTVFILVIAHRREVYPLAQKRL